MILGKKMITGIITTTLVGTFSGGAGGYLARVFAWLNASLVRSETSVILDVNGSLHVAGAITGFASCLCLSLIFTRLMVSRQWRGSMGFSLGFGALAGAIPAAVIGITFDQDIYTFVLVTGIFIGIVFGLTFGLVIWSIFAPKVII
jgi:hypothetical protein